MNKIKLKIGETTYEVKVAETEEQREKGLQEIESLPENEGMLFAFDDTEEVSM